MLRHHSSLNHKTRAAPEFAQNQIRQIWGALNNGNLTGAREKCDRLMRDEPSNAEGWHLAALIAHQMGEVNRAIECLKQAIQLDRENPQYHNNLGVIYRSVDRFDEAVSCYQTAIKLTPDNAEAHSNLGAVWRARGEFEAAIGCCRDAIRLSPDAEEGYFNLALTYQAMGLSTEAICAYRQVLKTNPKHAVAWHNSGTALLNQNRFDQAAVCFNRALAIASSYPEAHNSLSNVRRIQKRPAEAIAHAEKALGLKPGYPDALAHAAVLYQQLCRWDQLNSVEPELTLQTRSTLKTNTRPSETPLFAVGFRPDPQINYAIASEWSHTYEVRAARLNKKYDFSSKLTNHGRITIGYLSGDFRDHPVAHQILGMPAAHNRCDFRVFCYSAGADDNSLYRRQIERNCDKFTDIRNLQDPEAADQIYNDGVDILVDLNGHTAGNRLGICALRPAPVQATYLGFPGTSGACFFDYIITDKIVTPEADLGYYAEQPVYLPHSYMITDDTQPISKLPLSRTEVGLPETGFIFCSFNSAYKFEPVLFQAWMSILTQVPESRLWLPRANRLVEEAIRTAAAAHRIETERLVFAPKLEIKADYLARLKLADMALDTRIYNGHVSTCDALWAGVPVLTITGGHFASRVSASILTALDIGEMITGSLEEYSATAVHFATDREDYLRLREKLARHRSTQPFFNTGRFVGHLESAYKEMWQAYRSGDHPLKIEISAES